jgi:aspartyl-tRNA(Asn)/glutamyl-tRNA(Gln) amidotransferase subunit B
MSAAYGDWEPVIGLEVHAQLLTATKLFCGCRTSFGAPPNTHTCPVCLGLPGALPVLGEAPVRLGVRAALALGCTIARESVFARKNYFYPDLPKGYQITQFDKPFALGGALELEADGVRRTARLERIHLEEDAGKSLHSAGGESVVDLNRAGTPLIEIVGRPDLRSPAEAGEYLRRLREILMALGVCDGNLEQGSFRCDANVSVRRRGDEQLGTRTELKNINSFRFVEDAVDHEIRRQIARLEAGQSLRPETRGYNADKRETYLLRAKEADAGYRYFPDPDVPTLVLAAAFVEAQRAALPELPEARRVRLVEGLGLAPAAAQVLTSHPKLSDYFDAAVALAAPLGVEPAKVANFVQAELLRDVTTSGLDARIPLSPEQLVAILALVRDGTISGKQAKELYAKAAGTTRDPRELVRELGLAVLSDRGALEALARSIAAENPKQAAQYKAGKTALLGFFVGQLMKATKGSADPALVNELVAKVLAE